MDKKTIQLQLLQLIEETDGYAILLLDVDGKIETWNRGAEKIKGYTSDEVTGKHFSIFYTEADRKMHLPERLLARAAAEKTVYNEAWRVRKDGTVFWGAVTITALHDSAQQLTGFAKITRDLTDRMELEKHIRAHVTEQQAKNKEIEQFVYIASHDLQEPLLTVAQFIEFLKDEYGSQLDENGQLYLDYITRASERMKRLIRSLLDYSLLGVNKQRSNCDCDQLLKAVLGDLAAQIRESGAVIHYIDLPVISGYAVELGQLFQNLISNAIKFRRREITPEVTVSAVPKKNGWMFSVADNGIGIDPRFSEKVFLIFQRLQDRNTTDGNGIGLAHCRKIAELHGGYIRVVPNPCGGSIFQFFIPNQ